MFWALAIIAICLNTFLRIWLTLNYHTFEFCSFTCYIDGMYQCKFPFKDNTVLTLSYFIHLHIALVCRGCSIPVHTAGLFWLFLYTQHLSAGCSDCSYIYIVLVSRGCSDYSLYTQYLSVRAVLTISVHIVLVSIETALVVPLMQGTRSRRKEEALDDLPWKDERGSSSIRQTLERIDTM